MKVVRFKYYGGSHYGKERTVLVSNETSTSISGIDLDKNEYRNFTKGKMGARKDVDATVISVAGFAAARANDLELLLKKEFSNVTRTNETLVAYNKKAPAIIVYTSVYDDKGRCLCASQANNYEAAIETLKKWKDA